MRMENQDTNPKLIFTLLNALLILGALVGIMTIDGGKWLINNPAFYQPSEAAQEYSAIPVTGASAAGAAQPAAAAKPMDACPIEYNDLD